MSTPETDLPVWLYPAYLALLLLSLAAAKVYAELGLHPIFWTLISLIALLPMAILLGLQGEKRNRELDDRKESFEG